MSTTITSLIATGAGKILMSGIDYLKDDQTRSYALLRPTSVTIEGPGVGLIPYWTDGTYTIECPHADIANLSSQPLAASSGIWNGPDIIPDSIDDGRMAGSYHHDYIWANADRISADTGIPKADILNWANGILVTIWPAYADKAPPPSKRKLKGIYNITNWASRWYHKLKRLIGLATLLLIAITLTGCNSGCTLKDPPAWRVTTADPVIYQLDGSATVITNTASLQP